MLSLFRRPSLAGIDIGSRRITVAEVEGSSSAGLRVRGYAEVPTPEGCYAGGLVIDAVRLGEAVRTAVRQAGIGARRAAVAVQPQAAYLRKLPFPLMPERELRAAVALQQERYIPFAREGAQYDLAVLPAAAGDEQMWAVLAAAPRRHVAALMEVCRSAGLKPVSVDLEPLALYRAAVAVGQAGPAQGVCIVDLGPDLFKISLFEGPAPVFSRVAEVSPRPEDLFLDIRRSLEFALTQTKTPPVRLLLAGGAGGDEHLCLSLAAYLRGYLSNRLPAGFAVEPLRPPAPDLPGSCVLAFGLSLPQEWCHDQDQPRNQARAN